MPVKTTKRVLCGTASNQQALYGLSIPSQGFIQSGPTIGKNNAPADDGVSSKCSSSFESIHHCRSTGCNVAVSVAKRHPNDLEVEVVASHTLTDIFASNRAPSPVSGRAQLSQMEALDASN